MLQSTFVPVEAQQICQNLELVCRPILSEELHDGNSSTYCVLFTLLNIQMVMSGKTDCLLICNMYYNILCGLLGGGSALLPAPVPPVTLPELFDVTRLLARAGATICQLNTLRKHLELMKGGGFAKVAYPAKVNMMFQC